MNPMVPLTLLLVILFTPFLPGQAAVTYVTQLRLPGDLYTPNGVTLEKGNYDLQLRVEHGQYSLAFLKGERPVAVVAGSPYDERTAAPWVVPVLGTHFLRSTAVSIGTDEERHYSETGKAQYEYEKRNWKATLRVYRSVRPSDQGVHFVFQLIGDDGEKTRREFILFFVTGKRNP